MDDRKGFSARSAVFQGSRHWGFTLIELMIVIAIIAILAAIAVPSVLAAIRAANERNASSSLKQLSSIELMFKSTDADQNGLNDYWVRDVAGLYFVAPTTSRTIRLIEYSVAIADGSPSPAGAGTSWTPGATQYSSSPKSGYWYQALTSYEWNNGAGLVTTPYGGAASLEHFGFIAYPNSYFSGGRLCFILNEAGTMWRRDPASQAAYLQTNPSAGQAPVGVGGVLTGPYSVFPFDPNSPTQTNAIGPWNKMD